MTVDKDKISKNALKYTQNGQFDKAIDEYDKILAEDPHNVYVLLQKSELLVWAGKKDEAIDELIREADESKNNNRLEDFIKISEQILRLNPINMHIIYELVDGYLQSGDAKRALSRLQTYFKAGYRDMGALDMLARVLQELNQPSKAVLVYKKMVSIYRSQGAMSDMLEVYRKVLDIAPDDAEAKQALEGVDFSTDPAIVLDRLSKHDGLPASSKQSEILISRMLTEVDAYIRYNLYEKADAHLRSILKISQDNIVAHERMKDLYLIKNQVAEAIEELLILVRLSFRLGHKHQAADYLHSVFAIDPNNSQGMELAAELNISDVQGVIQQSAQQAEGRVSETLKKPIAPISKAVDEITRGVWAEVDKQKVSETLKAPLEPVSGVVKELEGVWAEVDKQKVSETLKAPLEPVLEIVEKYDQIEPKVSKILTDEKISTVEEDLVEVDFFIKQNLLNEARDILKALEKDHPNYPAITERLDKIKEAKEVKSVPSKETREALGTSDDVSSLFLGDDFQYKVDDVFSEFRKGVAKVVDKEDSTTHFDLGIAYKEMGLYQEAIEEFSMAAFDARRHASALFMKGLCYKECSQYSNAITCFKDALHQPRFSKEEATGCYYEMGLTYEMLNDLDEAIYYFNKVYKRNPKFREVSDKIKRE